MTGFEPDELDLIRTSLRHVLDRQSPAAATAALLTEGWADLLLVDAQTAITTLAEEAGRGRSAAPVADLAVLHGAGVGPNATTAVIHNGLVLDGAGRAERFLRLVDGRLTEHDPASITLTPTTGFDPALGVSHAVVDGDGGTVIGDINTAMTALAAGRRALASQMVGAVDQMLTDTLSYVSERHQYGRAIGSFQTVKHRLAEVKVAMSAAQATVHTACDHAADREGPMLAMAAKALAGRAQELASTHCFQVHGGIAFTVEHGFHQWVRRGLLLDHLLGGHKQLTMDLGQAVIADGGPPRLPILAVAP